MNTMSIMADSFGKAVWGSSESKQEPQSGVSGDTSKGEPFDAGNMGGKDSRSATTNLVGGGC